MMELKNFILKHSKCEQCLFGKNGFYNAICAHCVYCEYSKDGVRFVSLETAEALGIVKKSEVKMQ